jgi:hypothetical protein
MMLFYIVKDEQGHEDVLPTMTEVKKSVKGVMWDRKTTWVQEVEVPQNKENVLALFRASMSLATMVVVRPTGRTWWVTERGGVKEDDNEQES